MAASLHGGGPVSVSNPSAGAGSTAHGVTEGRAPLRRAVYVHVSDLTSAYDIDHRMLEEELTRVRERHGEKIEQQQQEAANSTESNDIDANSYPQKRLQPPRGGYNLCVLVGKVNIVVDKKRVDGSRVRLAEVDLGDETGMVSLRARDDQIDKLQEVSERSGAVVLRNCLLELYQGKHIRLAVNKWGKLSVYPDSVASTPPPPSKMNMDRNFSLIDLSLVASELTVQSFSSNTPTTGTQMASESTSHPVAPPVKTAPSPKQYPQYAAQQSPQYGHRSRGAGRGGRQQRSSRSTPHTPSMHGITPPPGGIHYGEPRSYMHGWHPEAPPSYPYATAPGMPTAADTATQQMILRQQYEMQQRQLQQMYHEERQRQLAAVITSEQQHPAHQNHHTPPSPMMSVVGSGPLVMPMSTIAHDHHPPLLHQHSGESLGAKNTAQISPSELQRGQQQYSHQQDAPVSPNKMNPQAATFAPGYYQSPSQAQSHRPQPQLDTQLLPGMPMSYAAAAHNHSHSEKHHGSPSSGSTGEHPQQLQQQKGERGGPHK